MNANITYHIFFWLEGIPNVISDHFIAYLDSNDIYLILTQIKTNLIQDILSLCRRKICTARKRVSEQKFAGQRLLPGH